MKHIELTIVIFRISTDERSHMRKYDHIAYESDMKLKYS